MVTATPGSQLSLLTIDGRKLASWHILESSRRIALPKLPAGTYLLREEGVARTQVQRMFVK